MFSSFDFVKLNAMLKDFHNLTHMRITVYDDSYREITAYPEKIAPICRFIRTNARAEAACPQAEFHYAFRLYHKEFDLQSTEMDLNHITMDDEGALVKKVAACLPDLALLDMDFCEVSDEAIEFYRCDNY